MGQLEAVRVLSLQGELLKYSKFSSFMGYFIFINAINASCDVVEMFLLKVKADIQNPA